jgi:ABC-type uncharacterized transport system substrate-binding protein
MKLRLWLGCAAFVFSSTIAFADSKHEKKKVLHIDSYHPSFEWSADIRKGIASVLDKSGVVLTTEEMDTKRHGDEEWKKKVALRIKASIEQLKPDVIIATDDNASRYIIEPFYKNSSIPIVFAGINWDSKKYGYPYKNATGMEEVDMVREMLVTLKRYSKGGRIGYIAGDDETNRGDGKVYSERFFGGKSKQVYLRNYSEFKSQFLALQDGVDIIIFGPMGSCAGWDPEDAERFLQKNTKIPTGSRDTFMARFTAVTYAKYGEEQGEWAARTALKILDGTSPSAIPIVQNKRVKLILNMDIARTLQMSFPEGMTKLATVIDHAKP